MTDTRNTTLLHFSQCDQDCISTFKTYFDSPIDVAIFICVVVLVYIIIIHIVFSCIERRQQRKDDATAELNSVARISAGKYRCRDCGFINDMVNLDGTCDKCGSAYVYPNKYAKVYQSEVNQSFKSIPPLPQLSIVKYIVVLVGAIVLLTGMFPLFSLL